MLWIQQACFSSPRARSLEDVEQAWRDGKDFYILPDGPYCSIRSADLMKALGHESVILIYKQAHKEVKL